MLVVIDTNVLVSALLNPHGTPASVLRVVLEESVTACFDVRIMAEYEEVLGRPEFAFEPQEVAGVIQFIRETGMAVSPSPVGLRLLDVSDVPFAEVCARAKADYLITGNLAHFPSRIGSTRVVNPAAFLKAFLESMDGDG